MTVILQNTSQTVLLYGQSISREGRVSFVMNLLSIIPAIFRLPVRFPVRYPSTELLLQQVEVKISLLQNIIHPTEALNGLKRPVGMGIVTGMVLESICWAIRI